MMKNYLILSFFVLTFASCEQSNNNQSSDSEFKINNSLTSDSEFKIRTIDGCEYIEYDRGAAAYRVYSLIHKGDCKNPIHKCKCN